MRHPIHAQITHDDLKNIALYLTMIRYENQQ